MNTASFEAEERKRGIRKSLTVKAVKEAQRFQRFLNSRSKNVDTATASDLEDYLEERTLSTVALLDVHGLGRFFGHLGNGEIVEAIPRLRLLFTTPYKLTGLLDVDAKHIAALERLGVRTNNQLLRRAPTAEARVQLAGEAGIPIDALEKISRLSDLTRMRGVRGIRAKLYYDMGIQAVKQMAQWTEDDLVQAANEYVERSDFEGIATLPKEARFTVDLAKRLPQVACFS